MTELLIAYIVGFMTASIIKTDDKFGKKIFTVIFLAIFGLGLYYLLKLVGLIAS